MSQTFHPAEEGDLKPIKMRSEEMKDKAASLAKSNAPEEFKTDKIKDAVKRLKVDSKKLHKIVKKKQTTDAEITKAITDLHDVFHEIVGLCKDEHH
jgi:osmotically-inducible protein OsmY